MLGIKLAQRLKELRDSKNLTQKVLADQLGISRQSYSKYELGKCEPDITSLIRLASFYSISLESLLDVDLSTLDSNLAISETTAYHLGINKESNSFLHLSGTEAKIIMDFRKLSPDDQRELRNYISFKIQES